MTTILQRVTWTVLLKWEEVAGGQYVVNEDERGTREAGVTGSDRSYEAWWVLRKSLDFILSAFDYLLQEAFPDVSGS